jgi:hypothetical protein
MHSALRDGRPRHHLNPGQVVDTDSNREMTANDRVPDSTSARKTSANNTRGWGGSQSLRGHIPGPLASHACDVEDFIRPYRRRQ